ncbi:MAG TPA: glycosyltransferase [Nitrospirae bacterium]|nr:glycosyltransferase [Nitrospirota bacterium]
MDENVKQKAVLVLGMHRSGTSALTAGLTALGVRLGPHSNYANEENPKGFFENQDVVKLNDRILSQLGFSWSNPFIGEIEARVQELDFFFHDALEILEKSYKENFLWGIKDPRMCLLLPFWQKVIAQSLGCNILYVHVLRNPLEVAGSLKVRGDRFKEFLCGDIRQSLLLWFSHYFHALASVDNDQNILITFDDLIQNPLNQLDRLASFLEITPDQNMIKKYADSFLEKSLKHHATSIDGFRSQFPDFTFIVDFYENIIELKELPSFGRDTIKNILSKLPDLQLLNTCANVAAPVFQDAMSVHSYQQSIVRLEGRLKNLSFKISSLQDELSLRKGKISSLQVESSLRKGKILTLQDELSLREGKISSLQVESSLREGKISSLQKDLHAKAIAYKVAVEQYNQLPKSFFGRIMNLGTAICRKVPGISIVTEKLVLFFKNRRLEKQRKIIATSGLFDEAYYFSHHPDIQGKGIDPLTHFLREGVNNEMRPNSVFDPTFYLTAYPDVALSGVNPFFHYVVSGKKEGRLTQAVIPPPTPPDFDAEFYRKAYPEIDGFDPFLHYSKYGKNEGRLPCVPVTIQPGEINNLDRTKETIVIVSHEASRSGAPILSLNIARHFKEKYNVVALLLRGGELLPDFHQHCDLVIEPFPQSHNPRIIFAVFEKLLAEVGLKFAIVNSIESRRVLPVLANFFVPSLCLVHEFASYTNPRHAIRDVVLWASQVIFSARIVYENNAAQCEALQKSRPVILPQGQCIVPHAKDTQQADENETKRIRKLFRPDSLPDNTVVILGAGMVQMRKGVDLFLAGAARVVALCPQNTFRFVWVGYGFDPDFDFTYSVYLQDQINRSGLENHVCFVGATSDMDLAYELSDVMFLSSRLDPLPNVAIDAMLRKLPVICFDGTTGIADLLKENGLGESCVIPYLDVEQAAQRLVSLIEDAGQRNKLGKEIKDVGKKLFDMRLYVESLEQHALDCVVRQEVERDECALIEKDGILDLDFYSPPAWPALTCKEAVRAFVRTWKSGIDMRKPFPGFHPGIYEESHGLSQSGRNPLVAFIQAGKPEGPWLSDLIQPSSTVRMRNKQPFRAALHVHVFFVDLFLDIFQRLEGQDLHLDLLISVPSLEVAEEVRALVQGYTNGRVDIRPVPNRGRDIGPLLTEFRETILNDYDVIGHVHTKKSGDVKDLAMGQTWVKFLLENLIGKEYPMASTILERMADNETLGLVFPDDPWVIGWSGNKERAEDLAHQLGIHELPDRYFNFPMGTMFWARTEALQPLLTKNLRWEDYPEEPLPYDGTVLHALERLLPFVSKKMGYQVAMTHVPGMTR